MSSWICPRRRRPLLFSSANGLVQNSVVMVLPPKRRCFTLLLPLVDPSFSFLVFGSFCFRTNSDIRCLFLPFSPRRPSRPLFIPFLFLVFTLFSWFLSYAALCFPFLFFLTVGSPQTSLFLFLLLSSFCRLFICFALFLLLFFFFLSLSLGFFLLAASLFSSPFLVLFLFPIFLWSAPSPLFCFPFFYYISFFFFFLLASVPLLQSTFRKLEFPFYISSQKS